MARISPLTTPSATNDTPGARRFKLGARRIPGEDSATRAWADPAEHAIVGAAFDPGIVTIHLLRRLRLAGKTEG
jgi:hypothetical protein